MRKGPTLFIMRFRISIPAEAGISCSHPSHCHSSEGWNLLSLTPINTVIPAKAGTSKITFFRRQETSHASPKQILMQIGNLQNIPRSIFDFSGCCNLQNNFFRMWETSHSSPKQILMQIGNLPNIPKTILTFPQQKFISRNNRFL